MPFENDVDGERQIASMVSKLIAVGGGIACFAVTLKVYLKVTTGRYKIKKDLNGKVFLITGASAGER